MGWRFKGNELKYLKEVLDSDFKLANGSMIKRFEDKFGQVFDMPYAITTTSGTAALHQALLACGIRPGDEVIVPPLTPLMCTLAVIYCRAKPVFADVRSDTFLLDPEDVKRKITPKTKVIMPVHLCGHICDMDEIMSIARGNDFRIIEDCAQCCFGRDHKGRVAGTIGDIGIFSFGEYKMLSSSEGGALITKQNGLAERIRKVGHLGFKNVSAENAGSVGKNPLRIQDPSFLRHDSIGLNYIMSEFTGAVALAQLERINWFLSKRVAMAKLYKQAIGNCDWLKTQSAPPGSKPTFWTYAVLFEGQEKLGISWYEFRNTFIQFGGDKIRAALALVYNDPAIFNLSQTGCFFHDQYEQGEDFKNFLKDNQCCPNAEYLQPRLMYFTTNQENKKEMQKQADALRRTIEYFNTCH
ncbi:MAG: DegT/DnrJ/EryC1/StrS family aminotransferase [Candidatus Yanofskybacteria bacterium]|nr:DegT/DnrJ/EryC1/StrS family aminotransferase [Candidatus Yanofskybacteria bacterium]